VLRYIKKGNELRIVLKYYATAFIAVFRTCLLTVMTLKAL